MSKSATSLPEKTWFAPNAQEAARIYQEDTTNLPIASPIFSVSENYNFGFSTDQKNQEAKMRELFPFSQKIRGDGACFFNACLTHTLNKCVENPDKWNALRKNLINQGEENIANAIGEESESLTRQKVNQLLQVKGDDNIIKKLSTSQLIPQHSIFIINQVEHLKKEKQIIDELSIERVNFENSSTAHEYLKLKTAINNKIKPHLHAMQEANRIIKNYDTNDLANTYLESDVLPIISLLCDISKENIYSLSTAIVASEFYGDEALSNPDKIYLWNPDGQTHFDLLYSRSDITLQNNIQSLHPTVQKKEQKPKRNLMGRLISNVKSSIPFKSKPTIDNSETNEVTNPSKKEEINISTLIKSIQKINGRNPLRRQNLINKFVENFNNITVTSKTTDKDISKLLSEITKVELKIEGSVHSDDGDDSPEAEVINDLFSGFSPSNKLSDDKLNEILTKFNPDQKDQEIVSALDNILKQDKKFYSNSLKSVNGLLNNVKDGTDITYSSKLDSLLDTTEVLSEQNAEEKGMKTPLGFVTERLSSGSTTANYPTKENPVKKNTSLSQPKNNIPNIPQPPSREGQISESNTTGSHSQIRKKAKRLINIEEIPPAEEVSQSDHLKKEEINISTLIESIQKINGRNPSRRQNLINKFVENFNNITVTSKTTDKDISKLLSEITKVELKIEGSVHSDDGDDSPEAEVINDLFSGFSPSNKLSDDKLNEILTKFNPDQKDQEIVSALDNILKQDKKFYSNSLKSVNGLLNNVKDGTDITYSSKLDSLDTTEVLSEQNAEEKNKETIDQTLGKSRADLLNSKSDNTLEKNIQSTTHEKDQNEMKTPLGFVTERLSSGSTTANYPTKENPVKKNTSLSQVYKSPQEVSESQQKNNIPQPPSREGQISESNTTGSHSQIRKKAKRLTKIEDIPPAEEVSQSDHPKKEEINISTLIESIKKINGGDGQTLGRQKLINEFVNNFNNITADSVTKQLNFIPELLSEITKVELKSARIVHSNGGEDFQEENPINELFSGFNPSNKLSDDKLNEILDNFFPDQSDHQIVSDLHNILKQVNESYRESLLSVANLQDFLNSLGEKGDNLKTGRSDNDGLDIRSLALGGTGNIESQTFPSATDEEKRERLLKTFSHKDTKIKNNFVTESIGNEKVEPTKSNIIKNILNESDGFTKDLEILSALQTLPKQDLEKHPDRLELLKKLISYEFPSTASTKVKSAKYLIENIDENIFEQKIIISNLFSTESDLLCSIINAQIDTSNENHSDLAIAIVKRHPNIKESAFTDGEMGTKTCLDLAVIANNSELVKEILTKDLKIIESSSLLSLVDILSNNPDGLKSFNNIIHYLDQNRQLASLLKENPIGENALSPIVHFYSSANKDFLDKILSLNSANNNLRMELLKTSIRQGKEEVFELIIPKLNIDELKEAKEFMENEQKSLETDKESPQLSKYLEKLTEFDTRITTRISNLENSPKPPVPPQNPKQKEEEYQEIPVPDSNQTNNSGWSLKGVKGSPKVEAFKVSAHPAPGTVVDVITVIPFKHINQHQESLETETIDISQRGGDFRVINNVYDQLDYNTGLGLKDNINDTFLNILNIASEDARIDKTQAAQLIKLAKEHNGLGQFLKENKAQALEVFKNIGVTLQQTNLFSSNFQNICKECGLYTGRSENLTKFVGLRLPFVPDEVLSKFMSDDNNKDHDISENFVEDTIVKVKAEISDQKKARTSQSGKVFSPSGPTAGTGVGI